MKDFFVIFFVAVFLCSCHKKNNLKEVDFGYDYYPLEIGKFVVYNVDSIVYNEFTFKAKTYKYQIKEKIEGQFIDSEGKVAFRLARYIKKYDSSKVYSVLPWVIKDVWQVNASKTSIEVVEENVRFTKLIFPIKISETWNGNSKNYLEEWDYKYTYTNNGEKIGSIYFENVLLVTQKSFRPKILWQKYLEKYSKNVGLVYKEVIDIKFPVTNESVPLDSIKDKQGVVLKMELVSFGKEN